VTPTNTLEINDVSRTAIKLILPVPSALGTITRKHYVIHNVHTVFHHHYRRMKPRTPTSPRLYNTYTELDEVWMCCFWDMWVVTQTNKNVPILQRTVNYIFSDIICLELTVNFVTLQILQCCYTSLLHQCRTTGVQWTQSVKTASIWQSEMKCGKFHWPIESSLQLFFTFVHLHLQLLQLWTLLIQLFTQVREFCLQPSPNLLQFLSCLSPATAHIVLHCIPLHGSSRRLYYSSISQ